MLSFGFKDYGGAQVSSFFIHFIMGGIIPLIIFILRLIKSTRSIGVALGWILRLVPSFSFGYGVLNIGSRTLYSRIDGNKEPYGTFDLNIAGGDVILLAIEGIVYFFLILLIEFLSTKKGFSELLSGENKVAYENKEYDDDVQREMEKVAQSSPNDYTVRV